MDDREAVERMARIEAKLDEILIRVEHGDNTLSQRITFLQDRHDDLAIVVGQNQEANSHLKEEVARVREKMANAQSFTDGISSTTKFVVGLFSFLFLLLQMAIAANTLGG